MRMTYPNDFEEMQPSLLGDKCNSVSLVSLHWLSLILLYQIYGSLGVEPQKPYSILFDADRSGGRHQTTGSE